MTLKTTLFTTICFSFSWSLTVGQTDRVKEPVIDTTKKEEIKLHGNLQEVEVTGIKEHSYKNENSFSYAKTEMPVKDIPQSISSVTKELIQDRQALRLKEIVQHVAGVNEFSVYDELTMRGFRSSGTNCRLLNGLRTYNNYWTSPLLVTIERVEFIKGPASAVFANANPGGTVNMVTKKPLDERRNNISFTTGSFSAMRAMADFTGPLKSDKTLLYRLNFGYENAETFRNNINNKSFVVAPSISFIPTERTRFNADFIYTNVNTANDRGRPTIQNAKDLFSTPIGLNITQPSDFLKQQSVSLILSFNQKLTDNLSFSASYLRIRHDERMNEHQFGGYITPDSIKMFFTDRIVKFNGNNLSAYLSYKLAIGDLEQTILGGYDYIDGYNFGFNRYARTLTNGVPNFSLRNPNYSIRPVSSYTFDPANIFTYGLKYTTQGIYLQDLIKYKRFQLLLSLRQEYHHFPQVSFTQAASNVPTAQQQNALLPRVGLTYGVTKNINVYATYATGFEPQSAGTLVNPVSGGPFDPLTSELIEAGSKGEFFQKRLLASVAVYQITQNHILVSALDTANPYRLKQRGQEMGRGYEIEAAGKITSNLVISVNYAFNETKITKDTDGDVKSLVGLVKENAPKHMSGSWIKYTIRKGKLSGLGAGVGHSQVSKRETFDRTLKAPDYVIFNAALYYQWNRVQLAFNLNNIANKKYLSGVNDYVRNFPGAPRNWLVNIGYSF
ncbi:MAG TPA: TonB-dependent siderophore receptor [Bacteroidia bacterium]|jgi:iron complex outermembrane receptor protein|nr:TonB-dependent siderophore receptor [Bacteroidia bacterium]